MQNKRLIRACHSADKNKLIENIPLLQARSKEILAFCNESKETAIKEYEIIEKKTLENNILK